jgi:B9 protein.
LPRTKGYHRIECDTWAPLGDKNSDRLSFFLGTFPRLKGRDIVAQSLEKREYLCSASSGKVIVELEVNDA